VGRGIDLTGRKFGKLTVVDQAPNKEGQRGNWWNCLCDCGNAKVASAKSLNAGDTQSCGCLNKNDLIGKVYGRLTVKAEGVEKKGDKRTWVCECSCGSTSIVTTSDLVTGHTRSCGCLQKERAKEANKTHGYSRRRHPLYARWLGMRNRCNNPNDDYYDNYGGKGVKVCKRWDSFTNFLEDMGECPEGHTLDRRDNDGDYTPENCRWASPSEQSRNKSDTLWVNYQGNKVRLVELSEKFDVPFKLLYQRLYTHGWSLERSLKPWIITRRGTGMLVAVNIKSRRLVLGKKLRGLAVKCELSKKQLSEGTIDYSIIQETWLAKSLEDPTPWNDFRGCSGIPEDVILKQANEPDIIFSNAREAYRYLERSSLLDEEYTLKVFE